MWKVEGVSPYVGFRMGCIGWNCGGPLIGSKTTKNSSKSSRVDKLGVPGLYRAKNRYNALWTNSRARMIGCGCDLILKCTCFGP